MPEPIQSTHDAAHPEARPLNLFAENIRGQAPSAETRLNGLREVATIVGMILNSDKLVWRLGAVFVDLSELRCTHHRFLLLQPGPGLSGPKCPPNQALGQERHAPAMLRW